MTSWAGGGVLYSGTLKGFLFCELIRHLLGQCRFWASTAFYGKKFPRSTVPHMKYHLLLCILILASVRLISCLFHIGRHSEQNQLHRAEQNHPPQTTHDFIVLFPISLVCLLSRMKTQLFHALKLIWTFIVLAPHFWAFFLPSCDRLKIDVGRNKLNIL